VTIDGVWIDNRIHCKLTSHYNAVQVTITKRCTSRAQRTMCDDVCCCAVHACTGWNGPACSWWGEGRIGNWRGRRTDSCYGMVGGGCRFDTASSHNCTVHCTRAGILCTSAITHTSLLSLLQPPLVVAWLQSSNKGYSSRPYGSRTALPNRRLKTVLLCPWPLFSDWLQVRQSHITTDSLPSIRAMSQLYTLGADRTESTSSHKSSTVALPLSPRQPAVTWRLQDRYLATAVSASPTILALSPHVTTFRLLAQ
jgi:hypothetical protein